MTVTSPTLDMIRDLRSLWKEAFEEDDEYLDVFFKEAFSLRRCRCITEEGRVTAALYVLDCSLEGDKTAYIYAVATAKDQRGRGLCRLLMSDTEAYLKENGYAGIVLVPGSPELFGMYEKMGYSVCSTVSEFTCEADSEACELRMITAAEYGRLRRKLLPQRAVLQEKEGLRLLEETSKLYCGDEFLLAARGEGDALVALELLGDKRKAGGILSFLGYKKGFFRTPGEDKAFAMYKGFGDLEPPFYFGLAFDL